MSQLQEPVPLSKYLWTRLRQLGVHSVHGVPGDYNLSLLDNITSSGLHWVGNCNELNAGYAADGYARVGGIGAMVTTGGVGEISAINPHAGAFVEHTPIVHIVGSPALKLRGIKDFNLHHTLGYGNFDCFSKMFTSISAAQVFLYDALQVPDQIDDALRTCWVSSLPVYIEVPSDMAQQIVEGARLAQPLDIRYPKNDKATESAVLSQIQNLLSKAKRPRILIDMCATRQKINSEVRQLVTKSGLPAFVTPLAQGFLSESDIMFGGLYAGYGSNDGVQAFMEDSDLVIHIGALDTDITTYMGSAKILKPSTVKLYTDHVKIGHAIFPGMHLRATILALLRWIDFTNISTDLFVRSENQASRVPDTISPITHGWLWPYIGHWLQPKDIVLTDTGTASFGIFDTKLPPDNLLINISLWASIGYSLPSAQGAALATKDQNSGARTILFQGDGSFQLTCQELSTMIKHRLKVFIFILCNNGYTIEREVHDTSETYNDIASWDHQAFLRTFDPKAEYSRSFHVETKLQLHGLLADESFSTFNGVQLVEVKMPELDVPSALRRLGEVIKGSKKRV